MSDDKDTVLGCLMLMMRELGQADAHFSMRRRMNSHHPEKDKAYEKMMFDKFAHELNEKILAHYSNNYDEVWKQFDEIDHDEVKQAYRKLLDAIEDIAVRRIEEAME